MRELRGNVDTRLRKLDDGDFDAIVLATRRASSGWTAAARACRSPPTC